MGYPMATLPEHGDRRRCSTTRKDARRHRARTRAAQRSSSTTRSRARCSARPEDRRTRPPPTARTGSSSSSPDTIGAPYPFDSIGAVLHRNSLGYALEVQTKIALLRHARSACRHARARDRAPVVRQQCRPGPGRRSGSTRAGRRGGQWYWNNKQNGNADHVEQQFRNNYNSTPSRRAGTSRRRVLPSAAELFDTVPGLHAAGDDARGLPPDRRRRRVLRVPARAVAEHGYGDITGARVHRARQADRGGARRLRGVQPRKLDAYFQQWLFTAGRPALTPATFFLSTSHQRRRGRHRAGDARAALGAGRASARSRRARARLHGVDGGDRDLDGRRRGAEVTDPSTTLPGRWSTGRSRSRAAAGQRAPLRAGGVLAALSGAPLTLKTFGDPVTNNAVTIDFSQSIGANEPLRTGSYAKTLTFTLSTTTP